jgi:DNA-binding response OmpR family regulator
MSNEKNQTALICLPAHGSWQRHIFSPLLAKSIGGMEGLSAGKIQYNSTTSCFFLGERELTGLSDRDQRLLQFFILHPRQAHTIDDLVEAAWTDDEQEGVTDEAVQQAIHHLRKQIEPNPAKPCYLVTERGVGYRFFPEGAPRG